MEEREVGIRVMIGGDFNAGTGEEGGEIRGMKRMKEEGAAEGDPRIRRRMGKGGGCVSG